MKWTLWLLAVLLVLPAHADELRNPDVPFGYMAVDLAGGWSWRSEMDHYSWFSDVGYDAGMKRFGVSFMVPAGPRATLILDAGHQRDEFKAGRLEQYKSRVTTFDLHLRFYLGK
ncbi:MAG: hypothetical protein ABIG68_04205 [Acidobacteriota bacterium]